MVVLMVLNNVHLALFNFILTLPWSFFHKSKNWWKCQLRKINVLLDFTQGFHLFQICYVILLRFCWFFSLVQTVTSNKSIVFHIDSELGPIKCTIFIYFQNLQYRTRKSSKYKELNSSPSHCFLKSHLLYLILISSKDRTSSTK